jgi:hypothetical protein
MAALLPCTHAGWRIYGSRNIPTAGGGIFVFAGATRYSFTDFQRGDNEDDRAAKKPDFISRLSAFINIRGINGNPIRSKTGFT